MNIGGEEYERLRPLSYPDTDTLLLMFSFGSRASLLSCRATYLPELARHCPGVPVVLVGGKKVILVLLYTVLTIAMARICWGTVQRSHLRRGGRWLRVLELLLMWRPLP